MFLSHFPFGVPHYSKAKQAQDSVPKKTVVENVQFTRRILSVGTRRRFFGNARKEYKEIEYLDSIPTTVVVWVYSFHRSLPSLMHAFKGFRHCPGRLRGLPRQATERSDCKSIPSCTIVQCSSLSSSFLSSSLSCSVWPPSHMCTHL